MGTSQIKSSETKNEIDENHSFKNALYTSLLFVGGGIGFFWVLLFVIFTIRG